MVGEESHDLEKSVSALVAEVVVYDLEIVEVENVEREWLFHRRQSSHHPWRS